MGTFKEIEIEALDDIWKSLDSLQASFFGIDEEEQLVFKPEASRQGIKFIPEAFENGEPGAH